MQKQPPLLAHLSYRFLNFWDGSLYKVSQHVCVCVYHAHTPHTPPLKGDKRNINELSAHGTEFCKEDNYCNM